MSRYRGNFFPPEPGDPVVYSWVATNKLCGLRVKSMNFPDCTTVTVPRAFTHYTTLGGQWHLTRCDVGSKVHLTTENHSWVVTLWWFLVQNVHQSGPQCCWWETSQPVSWAGLEGIDQLMGRWNYSHLTPMWQPCDILAIFVVDQQSIFSPLSISWFTQ